MRSDYFLALPVAATLFNVVLAVFFCMPTKTAAQQPLWQRYDVASVDRCIDLTGNDCAQGKDDDSRNLTPESNTTRSLEADDDSDKDPMLQRMPGSDFEAYVRADVSTFYGEAPGTRKEFKPKYRGQAGKFVNMSPERVTLYWDPDNGEAPQLTGNVGPWSSGGTACFPSHKFIFTKANQPHAVLCRFTVKPGTSVYFCDPFTPNDPAKPSKGEYVEAMRSFSELSDDGMEQYKAHVMNLEFGRLYKNFTGGSEWLTMYPRNKPQHKLWRADYFGQVHHVTTTETQFVEAPPTELLHKLSIEDMRDSDRRDDIGLPQYRAPGVMNITIKAMSCAPRAFEIQNFLSDVEADHILDVVAHKNLIRSTTAGETSSTRTSRNTWVSRHTDPILNAVFRRAADVLRLEESLLRHRDPDETVMEGTREGLGTSPINEDLQVVHYAKGQEYTAHHDFGYPTGEKDSPSRSINLCMYLNTTPKGGQTSFPRWRNGETSESLDVRPEKGKAMIFFMVNPDGNLDDLTHHAALPVLEGEKYFANLWIHDPIRL